MKVRNIISLSIQPKTNKQTKKQTIQKKTTKQQKQQQQQQQNGEKGRTRGPFFDQFEMLLSKIR